MFANFCLCSLSLLPAPLCRVSTRLSPGWNWNLPQRWPNLVRWDQASNPGKLLVFQPQISGPSTHLSILALERWCSPVLLWHLGVYWWNPFRPPLKCSKNKNNEFSVIGYIALYAPNIALLIASTDNQFFDQVTGTIRLPSNDSQLAKSSLCAWHSHKLCY